MILVMLALIMIQMQSFSRMFLVFATFPLGLIGAVLALLISQQPFGFVALLGRDRARRHDHAQHLDPRRPDRSGYQGRAHHARGDRRIHHPPLTAGGADGARRRVRLRAARHQRVLGTAGGGADRRAGGGNRADADRAAGALCAVVPGAAQRRRRQEAGTEDRAFGRRAMRWRRSEGSVSQIRGDP